MTSNVKKAKQFDNDYVDYRDWILDNELQDRHDDETRYGIPEILLIALDDFCRIMVRKFEEEVAGDLTLARPMAKLCAGVINGNVVWSEQPLAILFLSRIFRECPPVFACPGPVTLENAESRGYYMYEEEDGGEVSIESESDYCRRMEGIAAGFAAVCIM